jgi:hypothetical protein
MGSRDIGTAAVSSDRLVATCKRCRLLAPSRNNDRELLVDVTGVVRWFDGCPLPASSSGASGYRLGRSVSTDSLARKRRPPTMYVLWSL